MIGSQAANQVCRIFETKVSYCIFKQGGPHGTVKMSEKTVHEETEQHDIFGNSYLLVPDLAADLYVSALHISPAGIKGKVHMKRKCAGQKLVPVFLC